MKHFYFTFKLYEDYLTLYVKNFNLKITKPLYTHKFDIYDKWRKSCEEKQFFEIILLNFANFIKIFVLRNFKKYCYSYIE